ncbi:fimbria/pilus periplasmic chaperone [Anaeromyxobacter diazotrophicus]|uniref:Pili assembly chaperone N-terminal domain-containing protein n=1 Tax=Anaeromyxobacter diazotrophicus TaxID=2590199 RepID=A0A7I9VLS5_9BACT|nr:fimbria/pilus periplasmic chaperone [Anaeromyxobacter diazotrophicus]GEJ57362.1 hypothetical protein AMYX_21030 [Anaeromyxobacter diazotrophicus]
MAQARATEWARARARGLLAAAALAALLPGGARADQELMLFPTRLVLAAGQRAAQLTVVNRAAKPATFQVALVERRMDEVGQLVPAPEPAPGERFATPLLRFSPHQFTIAPGAEQVIRVQVRRPADLERGEYRSHLLLKRVAEARAQPRAGGFSVQLEALVGASIPVIVRQGPLAATLAIEELQVERPAGGAPALAVTLRRDGERSVYGDLEVFAPAPGGLERSVGKLRGVAVYVPNRSRRARVPLEAAPGPGPLRVTFREEPTRAKPLAEATLELR